MFASKHHIMKKYISLLLAFCISVSIYAQTRIEKIDELVAFCKAHNMFNGNILVAEKGEIIYHRAIGLADVENDIPLNLNTSFCLGSISKQFTAFAIMLLKEQEKLAYSTTVGEIFPELPQYMHPITMQNLMQHTSGLRRTHYGEHDDLNNEEIYHNFLQTKGDTLLFDPGTDMIYSNSGYMLLAMIVERVSGQSYAAFLSENIWKPLGMTNTFVMSKKHRQLPNRAIGFDGFGNKSDFNVLTYGSNGIYSSTEDLFRWAQSFSTDQVMDFESKSEAWKPAASPAGELFNQSTRGHITHYGFGYDIYKNPLEGIIGHVGAFGGFYNLIMKDLDNNREVIILTNNGRILPIRELGIAIQFILRGQSYRNPKISIDLAIRKDHYHDIDGGIRYYHQLKKDSPATYKFNNEWELNRLGYALLADHRYEDAVKILKLLVSEFPDLPNPHDSLGEAYYLNGQYKLSIKSYKKALEIDPNFNVDWINEMIQKNEEKLAKAGERK